MRDEIWYREELLALRSLVLEQIASQHLDNDKLACVALGGLLLKLNKAIETAPSGRTPEAAA